MKIDDCFQLGVIVKTHGYKGAVVLQLDVHEPSEYKNLESVFLSISGKLIPFFIEKSYFQGDKMQIIFEDTSNEESAQSLIGSIAYLPLHLLPKLNDDEYYLHDVIGYEVMMDSKSLGIIHEIYDQKVNNLFGFKINTKEVLVPFNDEFIKKINKIQRQVEIDLPKGYLNIYLSDG